MLARLFGGVVCLLGMVGSLSTWAQQESTDPVQRWLGTIDIGPEKLRLQVDLTVGDDGKASGTLKSVDQGGMTFILNELQVDDSKLEFSIPVIQTTFSGTKNEQGNYVGDWQQAGSSFEVEFESVTDFVVEKTVAVWKGSMDIGPVEQSVQFRLVDIGETDPVGRMDDMDQLVTNIEVSIQLDGDVLTIDAPTVNGSYQGTMDDSGNFAGTWKQNDFEIALTLVPSEVADVETVIPFKRPQTPQAPFPYRQQEVSIENVGANVTLSGTLTLPAEPGIYPVMVLISGSGPQDRDETLLGHKPFLVLADHLTRKGIAVLRYDDRGTAKSTGEFGLATSKDFASDALAVVELLSTHAEIDPNNIGLIGHSEGGLIAPMVAVESSKVAMIVLLAGPGIPGSEIIMQQSELIGREGGTSEALLALGRKQQAALFKAIVAGISNDSFNELVETQIDEAITVAQGDEKAELEANRDLVISMSQTIISPWFKFFLSHDPAPVLEQVKCPVLAVIGEKDLQVPADTNLHVIDAALEKGGNPSFTCKKLPGLNHLFQTAETGAPSEYQTIEETFAPSALELVSNWLLENIK